MLKKNAEVRWTTTARESFVRIKEDFQEALVLVSPSPFIVTIILLQRNEDNKEQPVAFFSRVLRDGELKYNILEKKSYYLLKALKSFGVYVLHSQIIAYVPNVVVNDVLTQSDSDGKRGSG